MLWMSECVFVDTAWNRKPHACYDPDADKFFEAERLMDLRNYEGIYLDSLLFPGIWSELRELLIVNGRGVYHFTRPWMWRELRKRFRDDLREKFKNVKKSDYGDAYILWKVYQVGILKGNTHKWFKRVTVIDVELKPLLMLERMYDRWLRKTRRYVALGVDVAADIELFKDRVEDLRRTIVAKAREIWPRFMEIATELGLNKDDLGGLTGLAGILTYLGWPLMKPSMHKAIRYFALYKPSREDRLRLMERTGRRFQRRYSGSARRYLNMLATAMLVKKGKYLPRARNEAEILRKLINTLKELESAGSRQGESRTMPRFNTFMPRRALRVRSGT